jgi:hypothetical protein
MNIYSTFQPHVYYTTLGQIPQEVWDDLISNTPSFSEEFGERITSLEIEADIDGTRYAIKLSCAGFADDIDAFLETVCDTTTVYLEDISE